MKIVLSVSEEELDVGVGMQGTNDNGKLYNLFKSIIFRQNNITDTCSYRYK